MCCTGCEVMGFWHKIQSERLEIYFLTCLTVGVIFQLKTFTCKSWCNKISNQDLYEVLYISGNPLEDPNKMLDEQIRPVVFRVSLNSHCILPEISLHLCSFPLHLLTPYPHTPSLSLSVSLCHFHCQPYTVESVLCCAPPSPQVHCTTLNFKSIPWWLMN